MAHLAKIIKCMQIYVSKNMLVRTVTLSLEQRCHERCSSMPLVGPYSFNRRIPAL